MFECCVNTLMNWTIHFRDQSTIGSKMFNRSKRKKTRVSLSVLSWNEARNRMLIVFHVCFTSTEISQINFTQQISKRLIVCLNCWVIKTITARFLFIQIENVFNCFDFNTINYYSIKTIHSLLRFVNYTNRN